MKNTTFLLLFLSVSHLLQAQWVNSGTGNIYYNNGNVGIGTSLPNNRLVVEGNEGAESSLLIRNKSYRSTDNTGTASLQFAFANHVGPKIEAFKVSTNITGLKLYTEYGYNNPQLAMTFKPSAIGTNVGIGTATPTAKLHVNNGNNTYGTILAQATESSFHLYAKTLTTQPANVESFRIGLKYNSNEQNGFISFYRGGSTKGGFLGFSTNGIERIRVNSNGNVGIGKLTPTAKLHVNGNIIAEEIKVENVTGADFVFAPNYNLMPLTEIEAYIKQNHHLPEVPSAAEMQANGVELGKMNMLLLQKIEELTLLMIQQQKEINELKR